LEIENATLRHPSPAPRIKRQIVFVAWPALSPALIDPSDNLRSADRCGDVRLSDKTAVYGKEKWRGA
jgi:hypothetical protein